jgi:hypothetical protein
MFEAFSSRYLFGCLTAYGQNRQLVALNRTQYELLLDSIDAPEVVLKIGNAHVVAEGDEQVPPGAMAVPSYDGECPDTWPRDENPRRFV